MGRRTGLDGPELSLLCSRRIVHSPCTCPDQQRAFQPRVDDARGFAVPGAPSLHPVRAGRGRRGLVGGWFGEGFCDVLDEGLEGGGVFAFAVGDEREVAFG